MKQGIPVILCIGSDKIAGDSVGPIVGDILKNKLNARCFVYGETGKSVNGKNVKEFLNLIEIAHPDSPVIAVDACLSEGIARGNIHIVSGGVNPKRAVTGVKNPTGDVGVLAVVEKPSQDALNALMSVSWDNVQKTSIKVAIVLYRALFSA